MNTSGRHLLLELFDCAPIYLNDELLIRKLIIDVTQKANVSVIDIMIHKFSPHGITGIALIEESHFSIHTWPEANYAAVDFYTCGNGDITSATEILKAAFDAKSVNSQIIQRGIKNVKNQLADGH